MITLKNKQNKTKVGQKHHKRKGKEKNSCILQKTKQNKIAFCIALLENVYVTTLALMESMRDKPYYLYYHFFFGLIG